ncbi:MAG: PQQ-dependent sugar dehydrogenase [Candidatus Zeuxoniibacter abyssi]|nr:MAG: PQQ-dependent sugar dehydrogenase [Candidatus Persebacteraceae bacterium AB1(2)]
MLSNISLPPGYAITLFADNVPSARQIAVAKDGWVFLGSRSDAVYALRDSDNDGVSDERLTIASGLDNPHGVAWHDGDLYIGEIPRIRVARNILQQLKNPSQPLQTEVFIGGLPTGSHHGLRHIKVGPDGMLYIALGTPCNICQPEPLGFAGVIRRYPLSDTSAQRDGEIFAEGIRNAVGFDWHPKTNVLWFSDNGRDWLGDDLPNDEINRAPQAGMHFGYPYCHEENLQDPEFGDLAKCSNFTPPALLSGAHVANLGMAFDAAGENIYIALHGSWNRSVKVGYAVSRAVIRDTRVAGYETFAAGWLKDKSVWGRPVDVAFAPNGDLLVSDDFAGVVYRIFKTARE